MTSPLKTTVVTVDWLHREGACADHVETFRRAFGDEVEITYEAVDAALAANLDLDWTARRLLTPSALTTYRAATAPATAAYNAATAPAWAAFNAAIAPVWAAHNAARASAWAAFKAATAPARAVYNTAAAEALKDILRLTPQERRLS